MEENIREEIIDHYKRLTPWIMASAASHWADPYCHIQWRELFSPIEYQAWQAIRNFGHLPMYPQYPVSGYFLDFGNPVLKVGIECDGARYHLDGVRDRKRDEVLLDHGWIIFRISGKDCNRLVNHSYWGARNDRRGYKEEGVLESFYLHTLEGLLRSIAIIYTDHSVNCKNDYQFSVAALNYRVSLPERIKFHWNRLRDEELAQTYDGVLTVK